MLYIRVFSQSEQGHGWLNLCWSERGRVVSSGSFRVDVAYLSMAERVFIFVVRAFKDRSPYTSSRCRDVWRIGAQ